MLTMPLMACILVQALKSATSVLDVCRQGTYRNPSGLDWVAGCPGYSTCPQGFFCSSEVIAPCPPGRFNNEMGSQSCLQCPAGYFCPQVFSPSSRFQLLGCKQPSPCGSSAAFCPEGAASPYMVRPGYYSLGGSADGTTRVEQAIAPLGFFAQEGHRAACPPGRFGSQAGLTSAECSGPCLAGFYCKAGSTSPRQYPCGSRLLVCPVGSAAPQRIKLPLRHSAAAQTDSSQPAVYTTDMSGDEGENSGPIRALEVVCPVGHYCTNGRRLPCPAGRFGSHEGQHSPLCSGQCAAGHFCPQNSTQPRQFECGEHSDIPESVFCPAGSGEPVEADAGYFSLSGSRTTRSAQQKCPAGSFCRNGIASLCTKGRYGSTVGSSVAECDGPCAPGFFCPNNGATNPTEKRCGSGARVAASVFCPVGSFEPTQVRPGLRTVRLTSGHYGTNISAFSDNVHVAEGLGAVFAGLGQTLERQWAQLATKTAADSLSALHREALSDLLVRQEVTQHTAASYVDIMAPTFARVEGLAQLHHKKFFVFEDFFFAEASGDKTQFSLLAREHGTLELQTHEVFCKLGHFCEQGTMQPCPAGRFGSSYSLKNSSCSGVCAAGFFCPGASVTSTERRCGNQAVFCPAGSSEPLQVPAGFLGTGHSTDTQFELKACPIGSFCTRGVSSLCPAGRFGSLALLTNSSCSGECEAGYHCPPGSTSPRSLRCVGPGFFCPPGSGLPLPVSAGYFTVYGRTRPTPAAFLSPDAQPVCYDVAGPMDRPPSLQSTALYAQNINSTFENSRYCRSGKTGDWDERKAQLQCPAGSFCENGLRYLCPPGRFGSSTGSTRHSCDGTCQPGFYCPWGSTSPQEVECGAPDRFCPAGSGAPQPVQSGYFSDQDSPFSQKTREKICPLGYFCMSGERFACPKGRFGAELGLSSDLCSGPCSEGYFCPDEASISNKAKDCGGSGVFCPAGSFAPVPVPLGTYSTGGFEQRIGSSENSTRTSWQNCPPGHFCVQGKLMQCPGGFWGNTTNEFRPQCSGRCSIGHFCPPGSLSPTAFKCGEIFSQRPSVQNHHNASAFPDAFVNVFDFSAGGGSTAGGRSGGGPSGATSDWIGQLHLELQMIELYLSSPMSADAGQLATIQVDILSVSSATARRQTILELLSRLQLGGMLPNVTIAWEAGYRFKYPSMDVKVGQYELYGFRLENGGSAVYCPAGSALPASTESGYYSQGIVDIFNRTQSHQVRCPPGSYCVAGIRYPCAPGRYGSSYGVVSRFCTAACPAGFACPMGSATPQECAAGTYSGGGMHVCSECPADPPELHLRDKAIHEHTFGSANPDVNRDNLYKQERCKTSRLCCGL